MSHRASEVWSHFNSIERRIIHTALSFTAKHSYKELPEEDKRILRKYYRLMRRRSRDKLPRREDLRINKLFRQWLVEEGLTVCKARDPKTFFRLYRQFRRMMDRV